MLVCPTGAIHRDEEAGPVLVDRDRCIGCKMCVQACPFGVITFSDGKGILKCDLCVERLAEGKEPACVTACPSKALKFVDQEQANKTKRQKAVERVISVQHERENDLERK